MATTDDRWDGSPTASYEAEPERADREAFGRGESAVMESLAERFLPDLYRFALAMTGESELAAEAVQETFLRMLESHRLYQPSRPFRPWLFTIARNTCHSVVRRRAAQQGRVVELEPTSEEIERLAAQAPTALEQALRSETDAGLWKALARLPEVVREIIILHVFEEMPFRQIAEVAESSPNTVASHYYRGLQKLRALLENEECPLSGPAELPDRRYGRAV